MTPASVVILGLIIAALALIVFELARTRADPLVWALLFLAVADLIARVALLT
jgi:hypothetical protein